MAIFARRGRYLAEVCERIGQNGMVDGAAATAVVMAGEEAGVAIFALAKAVGRGPGQEAGGGQMTGQAAIGGMNLACPAKGGSSGAGMATDAIHRHFVGDGNGVDGHRGAMAVAVTVEVSRMALEASAAHAAIDRGIAIAVFTKATAAVDWIVAGAAGAVNGGDPIAGVAVDTEGGRGHRGHMVVDVVVEILGVTFAAGMAMTIPWVFREDVGRIGPVRWVFQGRRGGVAVGAEAFVDDKRRVGRMAGRDAARLIEDDAVMGSRGMDRRRQFILVTVDAVDFGGITVVSDHHLHVDAGAADDLRVDVTGCVVTGLAVIPMGGQDVCPVQDRVAVFARFGIYHAQVAGQVDFNLMGGVAAAMAMAGKGAGVTVLALAESRGRSAGADAGAGGGGMTGQAAVDGMDLACPAKG